MYGTTAVEAAASDGSSVGYDCFATAVLADARGELACIQFASPICILEAAGVYAFLAAMPLHIYTALYVCQSVTIN